MEKNSNKWIILILGFIMMLCAGLIFAWSIFAGPIENDLGFSRSGTSLVFTISLSISIGGQIIAGVITNRKSPRLALIIAAILLFIGFIGTSFINSLKELYVFYGLFCGLGIGMIFNTVMTIVMRWFPTKSGTATGFLSMGFGMGGMVFGTLAAFIIMQFGWRTIFFIFSILFPIITLIGSVIMKSPPEFEKLINGSQVQHNNVHPLQMVRKKSFIIFFMWTLCMAGATLLIIAHAALCATDIGATMKVAALASGVISIFNGLSRVVFGQLYDRLGSKVVRDVTCIILLVGTAVILIAYNTQAVIGLFVGYALIGTAYGGSTPVVNSYVMEEYGLKHYGVNLGITNIHMILGSLLGPTIAGVIKTNFGTYVPAFYLMLGLTFLVFVFSCGMNNKRAA